LGTLSNYQRITGAMNSVIFYIFYRHVQLSKPLPTAKDFAIYSLLAPEALDFGS
jgi:hypothetical protein